MSIIETANYLAVSRWTVTRMLDDGSLPYVTVRGMRRVLPFDADEYLGIERDERAAMSITDTAAYVGVSRWTVRRWLDNGSLPFVMVGGMRRVLPRDADKFRRIAS